MTEIGGLEDNADTVVEEPLGSAERSVGRLLFDFAFLGQFGNERTINLLGNRCFDSEIGHSAQHLNRLLLRRYIDALFVHTCDADNDIFVAHELLLGNAVDHIQRDERQHLLNELILKLNAWDRFVVLEVADILASVSNILARLAAVVCFFELGEHVGFGNLEFAFCKAVAAHLLEFVEQSGVGFGFLTLLGDSDGGEGVAEFDEFEVSGSGADVRCVGFHGSLLEAGIKHLSDEVTASVEQVRHVRTLHVDGRLRVLPVELDTRLLRLFVGNDGNDRFVVVVNRVQGSFAAVGTFGHIRPECFDLCLNGIDVDIADYDNSLVVRSVPLVVVVAERLVGKVIDNGCIANDVAFAVLAVGEHQCAALLPESALRIGSGTPLFADNATFGINLLAEKEQAARPVVHNEQGGVDNTFADSRHIGEAVNGFVDRGVGVDVSAEVHTDGLEIVDNALAGEVLCAVERHVLEEVCKTVLVILLKDSADGLRDMEVATLLGFLVMTDVIRQTVGQVPVTHRAVDGQRYRLLRRERNDRQEEREKKKCTFHICHYLEGCYVFEVH